jgi:hypothetical protein
MVPCLNGSHTFVFAKAPLPLRLKVSGLKAMREEALASVGDIDWVDDDDDGAQTSADASASS